MLRPDHSAQLLGIGTLFAVLRGRFCSSLGHKGDVASGKSHVDEVVEDVDVVVAEL